MFKYLNLFFVYLFCRNYGLHSPVHSAAGFSKTRVLLHLINNEGFSVGTFLRHGKTQRISALQWAIHHQKRDSVRLLLDYGADPFEEGFWWDVGGDAAAFAKSRASKAIEAMVTDAMEKIDADKFKKRVGGKRTYGAYAERSASASAGDSGRASPKSEIAAAGTDKMMLRASAESPREGKPTRSSSSNNNNGVRPKLENSSSSVLSLTTPKLSFAAAAGGSYSKYRNQSPSPRSRQPSSPSPRGPRPASGASSHQSSSAAASKEDHPPPPPPPPPRRPPIAVASIAVAASPSPVSSVTSSFLYPPPNAVAIGSSGSSSSSDAGSGHSGGGGGHSSSCDSTDSLYKAIGNEIKARKKEKRRRLRRARRVDERIARLEEELSRLKGGGDFMPPTEKEKVYRELDELVRKRTIFCSTLPNFNFAF